MLKIVVNVHNSNSRISIIGSANMYKALLHKFQSFVLFSFIITCIDVDMFSLAFVGSQQPHEGYFHEPRDFHSRPY